jgi:hypothetical protein
MKAYDMRDPSNPRRVNICFNNTQPGLPLSAANNVYIMTSDYHPDSAYTGEPGTQEKFIKESYLVMKLEPVDSIFQAYTFNLEITPSYPNSDIDAFTYSTADLVPVLSQDERVTMLEQVGVVPNPYWAYSPYETSYDTPQIKFIHLDREVTIRIFNLAGQLVTTLYKNDDSSELSWNLRNDSNLKIASGMYIAHVEVPGVGSKILKLAIVQREERLDRF